MLEIVKIDINNKVFLVYDSKKLDFYEIDAAKIYGGKYKEKVINYDGKVDIRGEIIRSLYNNDYYVYFGYTHLISWINGELMTGIVTENTFNNVIKVQSIDHIKILKNRGDDSILWSQFGINKIENKGKLSLSDFLAYCNKIKIKEKLLYKK